MHPWEDWAETWAHYLHMVDTLETAKSHGLTVRAPAADKPGERISTDRLAFCDFESLTSGWNAVTLALNSLNRSMGMKDAYPFVLSPKVLGQTALRARADPASAQGRVAARPGGVTTVDIDERQARKQRDGAARHQSLATLLSDCSPTIPVSLVIAER